MRNTRKIAPFWHIRMLTVIFAVVAATCQGNKAKTKSAATCQSSAAPLSLASCSLDHLQCDHRHYSPDIRDGRVSERVCVADRCVDVLTLSFDTSRYLNSASAEKFAPGGEYNFEEFYCYDPALPPESSVVGEGSSLDAALDAAKTRCEGGNP